MIPLRPNTRYKIHYKEGTTFNEGDTAYFETLDTVPEAKHLIKVKDLRTGSVVDLIEMLAHPWDQLQEHSGNIPGSMKLDNGDSLSAFLPYVLSLLKFRVRFA